MARVPHELVVTGFISVSDGRSYGALIVSMSFRCMLCAMSRGGENLFQILGESAEK
tara:strand:+ start:349 stop:516 length:168 start_codon:yes stop_codon:yes gene_type:complete